MVLIAVQNDDCADFDEAYKSWRLVIASRSLDTTCNNFFTNLLSTLVALSAGHNSALSGGVLGSVGILSTIGGHIGIDGVNGVSRLPSPYVVIFNDCFRLATGDICLRISMSIDS